MHKKHNWKDFEILMHNTMSSNHALHRQQQQKKKIMPRSQGDNSRKFNEE
jgi:hypothetical protein